MANQIELELLVPARDLAAGKMAVLAGADAVYIGGPSFGVRVAVGNAWEDIEELVNFAHQYYVRVYVVFNTIFFDEEADEVREAIWKAYGIGVDAIIVQDMGVMEMDLPPIRIFASTQTHNYGVEQIKFLEEAGFDRVILARELSLEQIKEIRKNTTVDLETFVHGALCVSFSGRCYMSQAMCKRSANRGMCIQACRLPYSLVDATGKLLAENKFLLSLKDLNLSDHLAELIEAGITSFKIEGRLKDEIYVGNVTAKYRYELDRIIAASGGKYRKLSSGAIRLGFNPDLEKTFNRGYTDYFFEGRKKDILSDSQKSRGKFIGKIDKIGGDYFILDRDNDLRNGDGICWFSEKGEMAGVNINVVRDGRIYPAKWQTIKLGAAIYRNLDPEFEKEVLNGVCRYVGVDFIFGESEIGFVVCATDEDGNSVEIEFAAEKKKAQKPEIIQTNWKQQFLKLGGTLFYAQSFLFKFNNEYFVSLSVMNEWRREVIAQLLKKRIDNYPRILVEHKKTNHQFYKKELDYTFNVANNLAREFYKRHSIEKIDQCFEKSDNIKNRKLVTTKHCLRYYLGICRKNPSENGIEFKEPLYLANQGKKYRLSFDCLNCVMEIWNSDN